MDTISVHVRVKAELKSINLVLYHKIYSTPEGIVNYWSTSIGSAYRLEIIIDEDDLSVNPSKISKDMNILTDEWEIADQIMYRFHEKRIFEVQKA